LTNRNPSRRGFIRQAAIGTAGTALWAQRGEAKTHLDADVIVIGAGMAGVTAAAALHQHHRVIVLEGRPDRIGGRIWSSHAWADEVVDLGASWLTHEEINPLKAIADRARIRLIPSDLSSFHLSEADGTPVSDSEVDGLALLFGEIYAEVQVIAWQRAVRRLPDIPASKAFDTVLAQKRLDPNTLRRLNFFINLFVKEPEAADLNDISLRYLGNVSVFLQGFTSASIIPGGYLQLLKLFAAGLDIRCGHVVDTIEYGANGVAVTLDSGVTFRAKYAVVTLPLGVLKSRSVTFWPQLPNWKRTSIDRLHVGISNKVYFRFPHTFWPLDRTGVDRIDATPEAKWSTWFNFYKYSGENGSPGLPTLLSFNHSTYASHLEGLTDAQVIDEVWPVLKNQYKDKAVRPISLQRSHWGSDPFAHGATAHIPTGASPADLRLLGEPVANRLFFAGDSTTDEFTGFVLAAYQTGLRAASRILHKLGEVKSRGRKGGT
jgi:monoamine oxidase